MVSWKGIAALAAAFLAGFATSWLGTPDSGSDQGAASRSYSPANVRAHFSARQARMFGDADTLVVGDSLVEQADWTDACGRTFAAGIGGARVAEPLEVIETLIEATTPETVVLAIGTNYFTQGDDLDALERELPRLIEAVREARLVLVGIAISADGNEAIRRIAAANAAVFVDPPKGPMRSVSRGVEDGIHYTHEGSLAYRAAIEAGCAAANAKND